MLLLTELSERLERSLAIEIALEGLQQGSTHNWTFWQRVWLGPVVQLNLFDSREGRQVEVGLGSGVQKEVAVLLR